MGPSCSPVERVSRRRERTREASRGHRPDGRCVPRRAAHTHLPAPRPGSGGGPRRTDTPVHGSHIEPGHPTRPGRPLERPGSRIRPAPAPSVGADPPHGLLWAAPVHPRDAPTHVGLGRVSLVPGPAPTTESRSEPAPVHGPVPGWSPRTWCMNAPA